MLLATMRKSTRTDRSAEPVALLDRFVSMVRRVAARGRTARVLKEMGNALTAVEAMHFAEHPNELRRFVADAVVVAFHKLPSVYVRLQQGNRDVVMHFTRV